MTRPIRSHTATQIRRIAHVLDHLATTGTLDDALATLDNRADNIDGYPAGTDNVRRGGAELTPTEAAAEARLRHRQYADDIRAGLRLLIVTANDVEQSINRVLRHTITAPVDRCNGAIDPTCRNVPTEPDGLCTSCIPHACHECRRKAPAEHRYIDGRPACDSCARRDRERRAVH